MTDSPIVSEFSTLPFSEKLILWGMRLWVQTYQGKTGIHKILRDGFDRAGAVDAHISLDNFMAVLASGAKVQIDIRCPNCRELSLDEHRILGVIADRQLGGNGYESESRLSAWLPATAIGQIERHAMELAQKLIHARLIVRPRSNIPHTSTQQKNFGSARVSLATVH